MINDETRAQYAATFQRDVPDFVIQAEQWLADNFIRQEAFVKPDDAAKWLRMKLASAQNENFGCLFMDNKHRLIADEILFTGTVDGAAVYPRVVAQRAMHHNAAAAIFYHNHPSGVSDPSDADRHITRRLVETLGFLDVRVLDHIVVGGTSWTSLAERGWV